MANIASYTESVGQSHSASRSCRALAHAPTSVIGRLQARSLTGQSLQFQVHQHFGYRLHVTWPAKSRHATGFWIERRFATYAALSDFCDGLETIDGLCTCLSVQWFSDHLQGKSHDSYSSPCFPNQIDELTTPRALRRHLEEYCKFDRCACHVASAYYTCPWKAEIIPIHTPHTSHTLPKTLTLTV
jgi:hypothetical protein